MSGTAPDGQDPEIMADKRRDVLRDWCRGIRVLHIGHGIAGERFDGRARATGVASAVLATVVGTAIFSTLTTSAKAQIRIITAIMSLIAAALSTAQLIWNYPQLSQKHKDAAAKYGHLRRTVDRILAAPTISEAELDRVATEWKQIEEHTLPLSGRFRSRARRHIEEADGRNLSSASQQGRNPVPPQMTSPELERAGERN